MTKPLAINEYLDPLYQIISSENFLTMRGIGQEVPFFICPFKPEDATAMASIQKQLINKLEKSGVEVLEINLFNLALEIIQSREEGLLERIFAIEKDYDKNTLQELMQGILDPAEHLAPAIAAKIKASSFNVLFVTGIGEVFPYIRSHNLLNNLQAVAKEKPSVFFFPGEYKPMPDNSLATALVLFGKLKDDNYYRAYNILERTF